MTQYTDRFNEHAVHAELEALDKSISADQLELPDGDVRDGYERFVRVVDHVKRCSEQVDPELVSAQALMGLQKQVHSLKDHHEAFKQNNDVNALNNQADERGLLSIRSGRREGRNQRAACRGCAGRGLIWERIVRCHRS